MGCSIFGENCTTSIYSLTSGQCHRLATGVKSLETTNWGCLELPHCVTSKKFSAIGSTVLWLGETLEGPFFKSKLPLIEDLRNLKQPDVLCRCLGCPCLNLPVTGDWVDRRLYCSMPSHWVMVNACELFQERRNLQYIFHEIWSISGVLCGTAPYPIGDGFAPLFSRLTPIRVSLVVA